MLRLRVASAAVLIPVLIGALLVGEPLLSLLIAAVVGLAGWETAALLRSAGLAAQRELVIGLGLAWVALAWWRPADDRATVLLLAAAMIVPAVVSLARPDPREGFQAWAATAFGGLYVGLLAFLVRVALDAPAIPAGAPAAGLLDAGRVWLLGLVVTVWSFDTFAYVVGRTYGRGHFLAHISPSKTWSGVVGGTLGAVIVGSLCAWATGQGPLLGVVLGLLVAVAAQTGDVAESMLKRAAVVKDSGHLIPGHGGMLDRVDSFLFAGPAMYLFLVFIVPRA